MIRTNARWEKTPVIPEPPCHSHSKLQLHLLYDFNGKVDGRLDLLWVHFRWLDGFGSVKNFGQWRLLILLREGLDQAWVKFLKENLLPQ